jgi:hypothetical protein
MEQESNSSFTPLLLANLYGLYSFPLPMEGTLTKKKEDEEEILHAISFDQAILYDLLFAKKNDTTIHNSYFAIQQIQVHQYLKCLSQTGTVQGMVLSKTLPKKNTYDATVDTLYGYAIPMTWKQTILLVDLKNQEHMDILRQNKHISTNPVQLDVFYDEGALNN